MLVSVVIPACDARATLPRALQSLRDQTYPRWEAIIVSDDGSDYGEWLDGIGFADPRVRHASTGQVRSGCHNARNTGLAGAAGELIAALDADDFFRPDRLKQLVPLATLFGAVADDVVMESEETGREIGRTLPCFKGTRILGLADILALNAPISPVVRRDHAEPRWPGVELSEDVIANLRLAARLSGLPVVPDAGYVYRIVEGSICNEAESAARFEAAYSDYLAQVETGHAFGLPSAVRGEVARGLRAKREVNRMFADARLSEPSLAFADFAARVASAEIRQPSPAAA